MCFTSFQLFFLAMFCPVLFRFPSPKMRCLSRLEEPQQQFHFQGTWDENSLHFTLGPAASASSAVRRMSLDGSWRAVNLDPREVNATLCNIVILVASIAPGAYRDERSDWIILWPNNCSSASCDWRGNQDACFRVQTDKWKGQEGTLPCAVMYGWVHWGFCCVE